MMMFNSSTSDTNVYLSKENVDFGWSQQIENPSIKTSKRNDLSDSIDIDLDGLDPINSDDLTVNIDDDDDDIMVIVDSDDVPKFESSSSSSSNQPIRRQVKSSSEEDFDDDNGQNQQHQQQQQHSFINDNVDYVMHSPRTVQTKYGALQGIVITFVRYNDDDDDSDNEKSTSTSSTSSPSANQNHNNSSSSSSIPTPIITLTPVEAFLGVPYATPPSGNLRFMPPVAPVHWRGVRQANHLSPVCPQSLPFSSMNLSSSSTIDSSELQQKLHISPRHYERLQRQIPFLSNQSEDCLYLNIYVPTGNQNGKNQQQQQRYPVIVFISGESYQTGTGNSFDASIWSSYGNVIVVTLNYRLGVLGFLPALVDGTIRGNYGLMDQVAALHWIQENIAEFGGEPTNVTLIGHGFGASCVHLLMLSPMAKGLFNRVALLSGSALAPSAIARESENNARLLAKQLNCPVYDNTQSVDCLKRKSFDEILKAMDHIHISRYLSPFGPIIDGIVVVEEPRIMMESMVYGPLSSSSSSSKIASSSSSSNYVFLKNSASSSSISSDLFAANHYHGDILFGVTRVQCPLDVFTGYEERYGINVERRNQILRTLIRNLFDFHQQTIFWTLINEYTDWSRPSEHPINLLDSTIDILGHSLVLAPLIETVELYAKSMPDRFPYNTKNNKDATFDFAYHSHDHHQQQDSKSGKIFFYVFQNNPKSISFESLSSTSSSFLGSIDGISMMTSGQLQSIDQRLGSMLNDELDYMFGAPIAQHVTGHSIGHFQNNWNVSDINGRRQDLFDNNIMANNNDNLLSTTTAVIAEQIHLSQMMITYFSNFAKYGNPNHPGDSDINNNNNNNNNNILHNHHHSTNNNLEDSSPSLSSSSSSSIRNENNNNNNNKFRTSSTIQPYLLNWPQYTVGQQRFLLLGSKPRLRDHYQSHRLSYWLNLIPHLLQDQYRHLLNRKQYTGIATTNNNNNNNHHMHVHHSDQDISIIPDSLDLDMDSEFGSQDNIGLRYIRHHLLDNFDDPNSYDGHVRQLTLEHNIHGKNGQQLNSVGGTGVQSTMKKFPGNWLRSSPGSLFRMNADQSSNDSDFSFVDGQFQMKSASGQQHTAFKDNLQQPDIDDNTTTTSKRHSSGGDSGTDNSHNLLQATIAVGCSLLALNLLVFAGVYYNLQRQNNSTSVSSTQDSIVDSTSCTKFIPANKMDDSIRSGGVGHHSSHNQPHHHHHHQQQQQQSTCFSNPMGMLCANNSNYYGNNVNTVSENLIDSNTGAQHIIHHVHYADQQISTAESSLNNDIHSHHHHITQQPQQQSCPVMETSDMINCSLLNDHHGSICQSPASNHQQQHHHHLQTQPEHAQYFPLHSFSSSSGGGGIGSGTASNPSNTTDTTDTDPSSLQQSISSSSKQNSSINRTIRFNLSPPISYNLDDDDDDDVGDHDHQQLSSTTLLVPSTTTTSSSTANDSSKLI
uniref:Uncharacterized protein LOC113799389 n=1 Tax=Dermatophagoides pteronyssinus TaxID=6956 RepID=A0A6P6YJU5_DERPT|nr:uncharacterized protein LOC113799389 [Dermatophagoides pteronyssinus]